MVNSMVKSMALRIVVLTLVAVLGMAGCGNPNGEETYSNSTITTITTATPAPDDFIISGLTAIADGSPKAVSVTPKPGKTTGTITVYYTGIEGTNYAQSTTPPSAPGKYAVTFNVAAAEGFYEINDLGAGTLVINQQSPSAVDPVAGDFDVGGLMAIANGKPQAVRITPQTDKSNGIITIHYTGIEGTNYPQSTTPPSAAGTYAVTFDVSAALGFNAASGLSAGTLIISDPDVLLEPKTDLNIHFLELGNKYTGDCVYINYGEIDIIIDAGSRQSSATTIKAYIDNHIQDNKLEYVIVTHGHQDHIAGFTGSNGILAAYEIGTIIDFPKTDSTTVIYGNYVIARNAAVAKGAVHYNALQCFRNQDGAQREYDLGGGVKLEILYNYYYENNASSENDYSVCVRIVQDGKQYIFTGDLEKAGEDRLVSYYASNFGGLGHAVLYKGGHHGSQTSANVNLMAAISPEYVCVCTCAGSAEYGANPENVFPSQVFINRIAPYTDKVYVTTYVPNYANNVIQSMNGNIVFSVSEGNVGLNCSNNNLKLKETEWFINNRTMPAAWR